MTVTGSYRDRQQQPSSEFNVASSHDRSRNYDRRQHPSNQRQPSPPQPDLRRHPPHEYRSEQEHAPRQYQPQPVAHQEYRSQHAHHEYRSQHAAHQYRSEHREYRSQHTAHQDRSEHREYRSQPIAHHDRSERHQEYRSQPLRQSPPCVLGDRPEAAPVRQHSPDVLYGNSSRCAPSPSAQSGPGRHEAFNRGYGNDASASMSASSFFGGYPQPLSSSAPFAIATANDNVNTILTKNSMMKQQLYDMQEKLSDEAAEKKILLQKLKEDQMKNEEQAKEIMMLKSEVAQKVAETDQLQRSLKQPHPSMARGDYGCHDDFKLMYERTQGIAHARQYGGSASYGGAYGGHTNRHGRPGPPPPPPFPYPNAHGYDRGSYGHTGRDGPRNGNSRGRGACGKSENTHLKSRAGSGLPPPVSSGQPSVAKPTARRQPQMPAEENWDEVEEIAPKSVTSIPITDSKIEGPKPLDWSLTSDDEAEQARQNKLKSVSEDIKPTPPITNHQIKSDDVVTEQAPENADGSNAFGGYLFGIDNISTVSLMSVDCAHKEFIDISEYISEKFIDISESVVNPENLVCGEKFLVRVGAGDDEENVRAVFKKKLDDEFLWFHLIDFGYHEKVLISDIKCSLTSFPELTAMASPSFITVGFKNNWNSDYDTVKHAFLSAVGNDLLKGKVDGDGIATECWVVNDAGDEKDLFKILSHFRE